MLPDALSEVRFLSQNFMRDPSSSYPLRRFTPQCKPAFYSIPKKGVTLRASFARRATRFSCYLFNLYPSFSPFFTTILYPMYAVNCDFHCAMLRPRRFYFSIAHTLLMAFAKQYYHIAPFCHVDGSRDCFLAIGNAREAREMG